MNSRRNFERWAWAFLAYLIAVILYGAWVRISHSGAGCGNHWPTCNGAVVPAAPSLETLIEFGHRVTSGLCGLFGLALTGWAWKVFGPGRVLSASALTLLLVVFEGAIGAGLVLGELVADNDSKARALIIALHLTNTLLLTAAATLTAWWAGGRSAPPPGALAGSRFGVALAMIIIVSMTGAVTALGDTLFPAEPALGPGLLAKVGTELGSANHFLVRLRVVHPFAAVTAALYLLWMLAPLALSGETTTAERPWARAAAVSVAAETGFGLLNVALAAPGWLQIVHLLVAQLVWLTVLLTGVAALGPYRGSAESAELLSPAGAIRAEPG